MTPIDLESPAKNSSAAAAAKNRQKSPSLLAESFGTSSRFLESSPLHFDWQSSRSCVSERIRSLFANTTLADVFFNVHYQPGSDTPSTTTPSSATQCPHSESSSSQTVVQRIPAHTFVLAISSAVFEAMFYGPLSMGSKRHPRSSSLTDHLPLANKKSALNEGETEVMMDQESVTSSALSLHHQLPYTMHPNTFNPSSSQIAASSHIEVNLNDVNPVAFTNVLRFIYTDEIIVDATTVLPTLYVAKKYAIGAMENACVDFLSQAITVDNAFMLLAQANYFDEHELAQKCLEVIDKNTAKAFDTDDFLGLRPSLLCSVLDRDTLCIREVRLFVSVVRWAKAEYHRLNPSIPPPPHESPPHDTPPATPEEAGQASRGLTRQPSATTLPSLDEIPLTELREILTPILPHIRFLQMSCEEFSDVVVPTSVLEDAVTVKVFQHFISSACRAANKPELPFVKKPRCYLHGVEEIVRRFIVVDQRWDYRGTSDRIRFKVDRKIYVVGFGLFGSIHGQSEYETSIEIVHPESSVVLGSNDVTYVADGSPNTFRVAFKEPIPLSPNVNYLASATIKGQDTYYGTRGLREITHECSSGGKVTFQFSYAACTNNGTSVEDGQIPEIIFFM